jgi:hypothetical protein
VQREETDIAITIEGTEGPPERVSGYRVGVQPEEAGV